MKRIDEFMCKNGFHEGKFLLNSLQLPDKTVDIWYECVIYDYVLYIIYIYIYNLTLPLYPLASA